jgi:mono/diheme cytochrome c family protein
LNVTHSARGLAGILAGALLASIDIAAHDRVTTKVTWNREIAPLIQARCAGCHARGGSSTIPLTTYEEARPWAASIKEEVLARRMPVWKAARGYGDFANDPSLSPFEIALVAAWAEGGAPEISDRDKAQGATAGNAVPIAPAFSPPSRNTRVRSLACGDRPLTGRLLAVKPQLAKGSSAGIAALLPGGRRQIVAWIRDFDPAQPATYWLRRPLDLPSGSRLLVEAWAECAVEVTLAR